MSKIITAILSIFIATGIITVYIPDAMATAVQSPLELCGNSAAAQSGNSEAEQGANQDQGTDSGAQSVSPEINALTGNNLGLQAQQNGECIPTIEQPPTDSTVPGVTN